MESLADGERKRPNWLLCGLMFISIGIHIFAMGYTTVFSRPAPVSYIEVELRSEEKLPVERIHSLPRRPKVKSRSEAPVKKPVRSPPARKPAVTPIAPSAALALSTVVEPIEAPERPSVVEPTETPALADPLAPEPVAGSAPAAESGVSPAVPDPGPAAGDVAENYFGMVRRMIESRKRYPLEARKKGIQGRVVVQFVIQPDGSVSDVSLVRKTRHWVLNRAALDAVEAASPFPRPPEGLFNGPAKLEIGIVFKLM